MEPANWRRFAPGAWSPSGELESTLRLKPRNMRLYVNDVAGLASPLDRGNIGSLDSFVMGSRLSSANINANMDDIAVTAVPEPATLAALGAGVVALLRRRSRKA